MPLAFDLISTLVIGVTLPVATTLFVMSPRSTLASLVGSILVPPRVAATATMTSATTATDAMIVIVQRRFLPFLPFATASSALGQHSFLMIDTREHGVLFPRG